MSASGDSPARRLGLTAAEAEARLASEGPNELPKTSRRTPWRIVAEVMREPMLALLVGGGVVYLILGDKKEASILLAFGLFSVIVTVVQEARTERVLESLRDLTSPRALVIRDGERQRIAGRDVVRGDLMVLSEGDRIPADGCLLEGHDVQADESLLTGESVPVRKFPRIDASDSITPTPRPGGDDLPYVFSGSLLVRGEGIAIARATGPRSEIGRIGRALSSVDIEPPRLQAQTRRLVRVFALIGVSVSALVVVLYGTLRGSWLDALLSGIAIGMSMLPEEFPVVLTVFMAMGAWRISKVRVLTRRAAAIETLGSTTVLCTDKTGTLTLNRMSVEELRAITGELLQGTAGLLAPMTAPRRELAQCAVLASAPHAVDPMERAIHTAWTEEVPDDPALHHDWELVRTYGLRPDLLAMSNVWKRRGDETVTIAAKGAPEAILDLCDLSAEARAAAAVTVDRMAADGLRVLGVARARHGAALPDSQRAFDFELLGFVGLVDPLRPGASAAVAACRSAGIRVVMITGDHKVTATAIARRAGIDTGDVITGSDLAALSPLELSHRVATATVFARILPEQKLSIVQALKANGEIVAMTGDGVNDAPSLKAAHIGVAMGGRGTDVAREASSIVVLDDDFGSIVHAIRLGRRIYDNLSKAIGFILAVHVPIAGLALLPLPLGLPLLLGPVHIAFLEMVIDPVCSLVFEAETEEENIMNRPPRAPDASLLARRSVSRSLVEGSLAFVIVAGIFVGAVNRGMPEGEVRALTFFSLVIAIVALIFANRTLDAHVVKAMTRGNPSLVTVLVAVAGTLALALVSPGARTLLRFGPLHGPDLAVSLGAGVGLLALVSGVRKAWLPRSATAAPVLATQAR